MKVKILNKALSSILPYFVENFDKKAFVNFNKENKISQSDLSLKPNSLNVGFPLLINSGSIQDLTISINQDNSVVVNASNIDIQCSISKSSNSNYSAMNSFKNKIISKCLANFNFSFVFTNFNLRVNSTFVFHIPTLSLNSACQPRISKDNINSSDLNDFILFIFNANNFSFRIKDKTVLESAFTLSIYLPYGSNNEKRISLKSKEISINLSNENLPFLISFMKNIIINSSLLVSSEFTSSDLLNETQNPDSSIPSYENEKEEEEDCASIIEFNIDNIAKWILKLEFNSILVQIEGTSSKILITDCNFENDILTISKATLINSINFQNDYNNNEEFQYSLSFVDILYKINEKNLDIRTIEEEGNIISSNNSNIMKISQIDQNIHFLTSIKNESNQKYDFNVNELEFNGSLEAFISWVLIQFRNIDLIFNILKDLSSTEYDINHNSSSQFSEAIDNYDYSNESSTEISQSIITPTLRKNSSNIFSDFFKKINSSSYSICFNFPLLNLKFTNGFNAHLKIHIFFSLKKKSYQIFGSDSKLSFRNFEPIFSNLSFQISVHKSYINALLSPSDFRFTEDEGLLMTYYFAQQLKACFNRILLLEKKRTNPQNKYFSIRKLNMTIVTFNLILCKNVLVPNKSKKNDKRLSCLEKNQFLMFSSNDISLSANSFKNKISINFKSSPQLKFWNVKTSFWDYVINPFNADVALIYNNGTFHFDANISSNLEVNVTPLFVDAFLPKCSENNPGVDSSKFSLSNFSLKSMKVKSDEILKKIDENEKFLSEKNDFEDNKNINDGENEIISCGSESVSIYNGLGAPIPINVINEIKPIKTLSTPTFVKIGNKGSGGNSQLTASTVTDEEHRKISHVKKDNNSSMNLMNNCDIDINNKQNKVDNNNDDLIVIENEETKLIPNLKFDSVIYFPSLNESIKISYINDDYIIHNEIVVIPSLYQKSSRDTCKLLKLLPRFEIQNKTKQILKFFLSGSNDVSKKSPDVSNYCHIIHSNERLPLNEIQCRKKISISTENANVDYIISRIHSYHSNLTDKNSNYSLAKLYLNSNTNKKFIKKDNNLNHSNERINRENILESTDYFLPSLVPNVYYYISQYSLLKIALSFKLTNPLSPLNRVLEIRPLFAVRNDLPFEVVCTFLSDSKDSVMTVNAQPNETVDLDNLYSNIFGIQFTACVVSVGISKTIKTDHLENYLPENSSSKSAFKPPKVTPFTQMLQKEIVSIASKDYPNKALMTFYMTFNYCESTGQFVFYLFSPIVIVNKTPISPLFINDGQNVHEFKQSNFPIENDNKYNFPTYIINSANAESLSISTQEEGSFVPLPQMSQFLNISAGKDLIYPLYIEYRKINEFVSYYELQPRLTIINKMPFEIKFTVKNKQQMRKSKNNESKEFSEFSFIISPNNEKTITKCRNDLSFSVSPPGFTDLDEFVMQAPITTVFRFSNEDEEKVVHFQLDKNNNIFQSSNNSPTTVFQSRYQATFRPASIFMDCPTMFVIVNNIPNYPIHAQQCEDSMPIKIPSNSTSLFPFDSPFGTPVVMITVAGKSQLIPLQSEIRAALFPFKLGSQKIYADLIVLSNGIEKVGHRKSVQALVIGYQTYSVAPSEKPPFTLNPNIEKYNFTFNLFINDLSLSFFTESLEEFVLVNAKMLLAELKPNRINFSINSVQIDDQTGISKDSIVLKSKSSPNSKIVRASSSLGTNLGPSSSSIATGDSWPNIPSISTDSRARSSLIISSGNADDDDDVRSHIESIPRVSRPFTSPTKNFIQISIAFNFNVSNAESFEMLVQPFDVVVDPFFAQDFLVYFARLLDGRKFLLHDGLIDLQNFVIHTINVHFWCREIQKKNGHFITVYEENRLVKNDKLTYPGDVIVIGENLSEFFRSLMLFGFQPDRKCSISFASLSCNDLNIRLSAFLDILGRHFGFFTKNALSYLAGTFYNEKPEVSFSRFQASLVISEFYNVNNIRVGEKDDTPAGLFIDDDEDEISKNSNGEFLSRIGSTSDLASIVKVSRLHPSDVFPVFACSLNMVIEYKTVYLIVQESPNILSPSSSSISLIKGNSSNELNVSSNSNLALYTTSPSLSNYSFNLGTRISPQKLYVANRINLLTTEMVTIESLIKKSLINDKKKAEKIYFLDYCGSMSIVAITDTFFFIYSLPLFNLVSKFLLASIVDIKVNKNRLILQTKKQSKWKSNDPAILIDLVDEETAIQLIFVIQTRLIQLNNYV